MARCLNPAEAQAHQEQLEKVVTDFEVKVREGEELETGEYYKAFITKVKNILVNVLPTMEEGDVSVVLATIVDAAGTMFQ